MKFRAIIKDDHVMREFVNILLTLAKMGKDVVFHLKEDRMVLLICCENLDDSPIIWCDIQARSYFTSYIMGGDATERNEIYFAIRSQQLSMY